MLETSPVVSSSANASPTSFRLAPTPASCPTPRRSTSRAASSASTSMKSPVPPRQRRHGSTAAAAAAVGAGATAGASARASATANSSDGSGASAVAALEVDDGSNARDTSSIAPPPEPKPSSMGKSKPSSTSTSTSTSNPYTDTAVAARAADLNTLSPAKRRGSPSTAVGGAAAQTIDISDPASPARAESSTNASKRARPDEQPPKTLPQRYELCAVEDVVELIAQMLAELIATNDAIRMANGNLTRFHSRTAPGISVRDYLHRLAKHATLTPPLLLAMVYYIDRLCAMYPDFTINTLTVHRFLITAATVAAKGLSDSFWNNTTYARVGGVRLQELKLLELEFLHRVDWKIVPNPEVLVAYYQGLVERTPGYELEEQRSSDTDMDEDDEEDGEDEGDEGDGSDNPIPRREEPAEAIP